MPASSARRCLWGLSSELIEQLAARTRRRTAHAGEVIFRISEPGYEFYVIASGKVRILGPAENGTRVLNELGPGGWFRDMALITGEPRPATAVAATDAMLLAFSRTARRVLGLRLGLVLSAGGAKGFAHLGALRCLEHAGLELDLIAGASMGGIVGGLFAVGSGSVKLIRDFEVLARHFRRLLLDFGFPEIALLRGEKKSA
jgi:CRP-like cAMP-binding protein